MPDLDEDAATALMNAIGHLAPARDLLFRIDAGRVLITLALLRDLARFGHQQPGGGALPVIFDGKRARHQAGDRPVARQRRHHQSVRQGDRAELVGLKEEFGRLAHVGVSGKVDDEKQVGIVITVAMPRAIRILRVRRARSRPDGRCLQTGGACGRRMIHSKSETAQHRRPSGRCPDGRTVLSPPDRRGAGWRRVPSGYP